MRKKHIIITKSKTNNQVIDVIGDLATISKLESSFRILAKEGIQFAPAVRERRWDGKIPFFKNNEMKLGLLNELIRVCKKNHITYDIKFKYINKLNYNKFKIWANKLNLPFTPREYQYKMAFDVINNKMVSAQSETSSGKSFSAYQLVRFMLMKKKRIMLIVPSIDLIHQMRGDFEKYNWKDVDKYTQLIGDKFTDKDFIKPLIITTWQSLNAKRIQFYRKTIKSNIKDVNKSKIISKQAINLIKKNDIRKIKNLFSRYKKYFSDYDNLNHQIDEFEYKIKCDFDTIDVIIGDEVDTLSSDLIKGLFDLFKNAIYRLGMTGTMMTKKFANWYQMVGNFGDVKIYNDYESLQKDGHISHFKVYSKLLNYPTEERIKFYEEARKDYVTQQEEIAKLEVKKKYLTDLINEIDGNTLILFSLKEKEGHYYREYFKNNDKLNKKFYYIDGDVKNRTKIIDELKASKEEFSVFASKNTMSRGINIPSLKNIILVSTFKSFATLIQSIGRIARLHDGKNTNSRIIDIVDNMVTEYSGLKINFSVSQYYDRLETYKKKKIKIEEEKIDMSKYYLS
jgi:superfamily II DNA or RNA helicase